MTGRPCITIDMRDVRTCGTPDEPRQAVRGLLCDSHSQKVDHAFSRVDGAPLIVALSAHAWEANSNGVRDSNDAVRGGYGSRVPIPESRTAANAIMYALEQLRRTAGDALGRDTTRPAAIYPTGLATSATVRDVHDTATEYVEQLADVVAVGVNVAPVAAALVRLTHAVGAAYRRFPMHEAERRVEFVRCPGCARMAMQWQPPLYFRDEVRIECSECHTVADQDWLEAYLSAVRTDPRRFTP